MGVSLLNDESIRAETARASNRHETRVFVAGQ